MNKTITRKLKELEETLFRNEIRKSPAELTKLLSDDFLEIGSSGDVYNKKQIIEELQIENNIKISLTNFEARKLSDNIIMVNYKSEKIENGNKYFAMRTSIWKLNENEWQMIFHQGTPVTE